MFGKLKKKLFKESIEVSKRETIEFYLSGLIEIKLMIEQELQIRSIKCCNYILQEEQDKLNKILLNINMLLTTNYTTLLKNTT